MRSASISYLLLAIPRVRRPSRENGTHPPAHGSRVRQGFGRHAVRVGGALTSGVSLWLAFPDNGLWYLAPVAVAILGGVTLRAGGPWGFALGFVAGIAFFVPTLSWSGIYVGKVPWFALAVLQATYFGLQGALTGVVGRCLVDTGRSNGAATLVPLGWVAQEWARSTTPFGGFPWARLAFSQADSPLAHIARWLGAPGVSFAVGVVGMLCMLAGVLAFRGLRMRALFPMTLAAAVVLVSAALPLPTGGRSETIGFVQGDVPTAGLDFNAQRQAVLGNHARGTAELAKRAPRGLSLVVWPENASDIDPLRNPDAARTIADAQKAVGVPLVVGAVLSEPEDHTSNVSLFYTDDGEPQRYTKLHPVPFAEYMPYREFFRLFTPAADLAGNFVAGNEVGVFEVPASGGSYAALPTICFEVAYDGLVRNSVLAAGSKDSVFLVQTNNATFGYSAESEQQFAISRIRAIEHGRSVVHVSTVGVSGFIAPDGSVTRKTSLFTPAQRTASVVLRSESTPADQLGPAPQAIATGLLVLLTVRGIAARRKARAKPPA